MVREGGGPRAEAQERRPKGGGDLAARALARAAAAAPRLAVTAESVAEHAGSISALVSGGKLRIVPVVHTSKYHDARARAYRSHALVSHRRRSSSTRNTGETRNVSSFRIRRFHLGAMSRSHTCAFSLTPGHQAPKTKALMPCSASTSIWIVRAPRQSC